MSNQYRMQGIAKVYNTSYALSNSLSPCRGEGVVLWCPGNQGARTWNLTKQPFYHKNRFPERLDSPRFSSFCLSLACFWCLQRSPKVFPVRLAEEKRVQPPGGARGGRAHRRLWASLWGSEEKHWFHGVQGLEMIVNTWETPWVQTFVKQ